MDDLKKEVQNLLKYYDIGTLISIKTDNIGEMSKILFITTDQGKYVIKYRSHEETKDTILELEIMDYIHHKGLPIQRIITNSQGKAITKFNSEIVFILEFIKGKNPSDMNKALILECARKLALLDKALLNKKDLMCPEWPLFNEGVERVFAEENELLSENKSLYYEFKNIKLNKLRKSIIHGDYRSSNLIVRNGKLTGIIDFGDSHYDFLILDLANAMTGCLLSQNNKFQISLLKDVMNAYEEVLKLTLEEKQALYYFFKLRLILIINTYMIRLRDNLLDKNICRSSIKNLQAFLESTKEIDYNEFFNEII